MTKPSINTGVRSMNSYAAARPLPVPPRDERGSLETRMTSPLLRRPCVEHDVLVMACKDNLSADALQALRTAYRMHYDQTVGDELDARIEWCLMTVVCEHFAAGGTNETRTRKLLYDMVKAGPGGLLPLLIAHIRDLPRSHFDIPALAELGQQARPGRPADRWSGATPLQPRTKSA